MIKFILLFAVVLAAASSVNAQSTLALQEKCAKKTTEFIQRLDTPTAYDSHYSKKLDGCFLRTGSYFGSKSEEIKLPDVKVKTLKHPHTMQALYNVFDGKMIGNFELIGLDVQSCWVKNTKCKTIDEFENLLKPYLEQ